jgi:hypothetical protein
MNDWSNFFVAIAGAAAALTGLIFVGVSISLTRILSIPKMPQRAAQSLILLFNALIVALLCLVPGQSVLLIGIELLVIGTATWIVTFKPGIAMLQAAERQYKRHYRQNILFTQLAVLPFVAAGTVCLIFGIKGIYILIPGMVFSFIKAVVDAWVLLVEINR